MGWALLRISFGKINKKSQKMVTVEHVGHILFCFQDKLTYQLLKTKSVNNFSDKLDLETNSFCTIVLCVLEEQKDGMHVKVMEVVPLFVQVKMIPTGIVLVILWWQNSFQLQSNHSNISPAILLKQFHVMMLKNTSDEDRKKSSASASGIQLLS